MTDYAVGIWRSRYFWLALVQMDIRAKYRGTFMGIAWALLRPLSLAAILCLVFHKVFHADVREYAPFLIVGLAGWHYLSGVVFEGCHSFFQAHAYIRQHPLPLAVYSLRTTTSATVHLLISIACAIVVTWFAMGFRNVTSLWSLIPSLLLLFAFGWGLASIAAFSNVYFRDTQHLVEVLFQLLFYATPIVYHPRILRDNELEWLVACNPFAPFLELLRKPVVEGAIPDLGTFGAALITVAVTGCIAAFLCARLQRDVIFRL